MRALTMSFLLASGVVAQAPTLVTPKAVAATAMSAKVGSPFPNIRSIAKGADLTKGATALVSQKGDVARVAVSFAGDARIGWALTIKDSGSGVDRVATGFHDTLFTLKSTRTVKVRVRLTFTGKVGSYQVPGAPKPEETGSYAAAVNVGDDSTLELSEVAKIKARTVVKEVVATIDAVKGLAIRTRTLGAAAGRILKYVGSYSGSLTVEVRPFTGCSFKSAGKSGCATAAPKMQQVLDVGHNLRVGLSNGPKNASALGLFGYQAWNLRLPTGCQVLVVPVIQVPLKTDAAGSVELVVPLDQSLKGSGILQIATLKSVGGAVVVRTTDASQIDCR